MSEDKVQTMTVEQLQRRLDAGNLVHFWHVLTDEYFTGEMIPGSRRVPLDRVAREVTASAVPKDAEIVVYCSGPACPQSGLAAQKLVSLGYGRVAPFKGGLDAWKAAGGTVVREAVAALR